MSIIKLQEYQLKKGLQYTGNTGLKGPGSKLILSFTYIYIIKGPGKAPGTGQKIYYGTKINPVFISRPFPAWTPPYKNLPIWLDLLISLALGKSLHNIIRLPGKILKKNFTPVSLAITGFQLPQEKNLKIVVYFYLNHAIIEL